METMLRARFLLRCLLLSAACLTASANAMSQGSTASPPPLSAATPGDTGPAIAPSNTPPPDPSKQDPDQVAALIEAFLQEQASSYPGTSEITVDADRVSKLSRCDQLQIFLSSGQRLRPRMNVGVRCSGPSSWTSYVQADLSIHGYYYTSNRPIQAGETLSLDDLAPRKGDLLRVAPGAALDLAQIIDRVATQRIPIGVPIRASALRHPEAIQRGQMVRTIARGAGFVATGEGRALQNGAPGNQIQVRTDSGQVVTGTVLDAATVQVLP